MTDLEQAPVAARRGAYRLLLFAAVLGLLFAALKFLPLGDYVVRFLEYVQSLGAWGPLVLAVVYVVATVLMVPGTILTLGAGFVFGVLVGTIAVSAGSVLGAVAALLVGRWVAKPLIERKAEQYPRFAAVSRAVEQSGFQIVLLTRLSPVFPFNALNYLFSVTGVSLRDYTLGSFLGMLPGTIMYVYFGASVKNIAQIARGEFEGGALQKTLFVSGLLATAAATVYITKKARAAMRKYLPDDQGAPATP